MDVHAWNGKKDALFGMATLQSRTAHGGIQIRRAQQRAPQSCPVLSETRLSRGGDAFFAATMAFELWVVCRQQAVFAGSAWG